MSIAVNGLNSYVDPSMTSAVSGTKLSGKLDNMGDGSSAEELKEVCREFESLASLVDYFKDGVIQSVAAQTTEQSGGPLAQQLYEQMKRNYGITDES